MAWRQTDWSFAEWLHEIGSYLADSGVDCGQDGIDLPAFNWRDRYNRNQSPASASAAYIAGLVEVKA